MHDQSSPILLCNSQWLNSIVFMLSLYWTAALKKTITTKYVAHFSQNLWICLPLHPTQAAVQYQLAPLLARMSGNSKFDWIGRRISTHWDRWTTALRTLEDQAPFKHSKQSVSQLQLNPSCTLEKSLHAPPDSFDDLSYIIIDSHSYWGSDRQSRIQIC